MFGDSLYWKCRRSMRFAKELHRIAKEFRESKLNSDDVRDNTILPADWVDEVVSLYFNIFEGIKIVNGRYFQGRRNAVGGPYLAVHLRRADFVRSRSKEIPSIENAVLQIRNKLKELGLNIVFIATDASTDGKNRCSEIKRLLGYNKSIYGGSND